MMNLDTYAKNLCHKGYRAEISVWFATFEQAAEFMKDAEADGLRNLHLRARRSGCYEVVQSHVYDPALGSFDVMEEN